jgi:hypothetical protein
MVLSLMRNQLFGILKYNNNSRFFQGKNTKKKLIFTCNCWKPKLLINYAFKSFSTFCKKHVGVLKTELKGLFM